MRLRLSPHAGSLKQELPRRRAPFETICRMQLQRATTTVDPAPLLREAKSKLESARSYADRATSYCGGMQSGMSSAQSAANSGISDANDAIRLLREAGVSTSYAEQGISALRSGISTASDYLAHPDDAFKAVQAQNQFRDAATHFAHAASSL
jgi:hypothetical protein